MDANVSEGVSVLGMPVQFSPNSFKNCNQRKLYCWFFVTKLFWVWRKCIFQPRELSPPNKTFSIWFWLLSSCWLVNIYRPEITLTLTDQYWGSWCISIKIISPLLFLFPCVSFISSLLLIYPRFSPEMVGSPLIMDFKIVQQLSRELKSCISFLLFSAPVSLKGWK